MIIKNFTELENIAEQQGRNTILCTGTEVKEVYDKLKGNGKEVTIFSIKDDNDGESAYVQIGFSWVNNIGYMVLEGTFEFENDYIDY